MPSPLDILCRVVDNYGDIGVVWRLAKSLRASAPLADIRIIVDNLEAFAAIHSDIDSAASLQTVSSFTIVSEHNPEDFLTLPPAVFCIEAFACGRAEWYDKLLYNPFNSQKRLHVIFEYLSAEPYAVEYHLLPSLSPITEVKKVFFLPGFVPGTGGLILDPIFQESRAQWRSNQFLRSQFLHVWNVGQEILCTAFWVSIFTYEHNFKSLVRDLAIWNKEQAEPIVVFVAAGRGASAFFHAWVEAGKPFGAIQLPFLAQQDWDQLLLACDFNIVRGEESLARAVLSGIPFLWHAYLQDDGYQRVKVTALLNLMKPYFAKENTQADTHVAWKAWRSLMETFNERMINSAENKSEEEYLSVLRNLSSLLMGFREFSTSVERVGNCAEGLLSLYTEMG